MGHYDKKSRHGVVEKNVFKLSFAAFIPNFTNLTGDTVSQDPVFIYPIVQLRLPCTSRTIVHGCQIVYWDPLNGKRSCPQNIFVWAMCKIIIKPPLL